MDKEVLLDVQQLKTYFYTEESIIPAVHNVSFQVKKGEVVALVGESGCGKSVTSFSILGLVSSPGRIVDGKILFEDKDLIKVNKKVMRKIRGNDISMIFQEPLTSLNPVLTVGFQITESIMLHQSLSKDAAKQKSIEMIEKVGIPRAEDVYSSFPHTLSGGMRQRIMIAIALSCNPKLLIADEPTTALDVTIQAQILELMKELRREFNTAIILITHDLGVVAELADRVIVMYAGQVVEEADVFTLFKSPQHPYTQGLMNSTPKIHAENGELQNIKGNVPSPDKMPEGCSFHPRCPVRMDRCAKDEPEIREMTKGNKIRCWLFEDEEALVHETFGND